MSDKVQVEFRVPELASEFFTLLEQRDRLHRWRIGTDHGVHGVVVFAFNPPWTAKPPCVTFCGSSQPTVYLDDFSFGLFDLTQQGAVWNPAVYPANPFMPKVLKDFLDELIFVVTGVRLLPCSHTSGRVSEKEYEGIRKWEPPR